MVLVIIEVPMEVLVGVVVGLQVQEVQQHRQVKEIMVVLQLVQHTQWQVVVVLELQDQVIQERIQVMVE